MCKAYGGETSLSDDAINAMSIVNRCSSFIMCVGLGISQGLQPVASFNYEAKKYARVKKALLVTILIGFCTVAAICVPVFILADKVVWIFKKSQAVIDIGAPALRYATVGLLFVPLFTPVNMMFQSIRKAWTASLLSLLRNGLTFIPILLLTSSIWGLVGIQISQPIADVLTSLISVPFLILFLKRTPSIDEPDAPTEQEQALQQSTI